MTPIHVMQLVSITLNLTAATSLYLTQRRIASRARNAAASPPALPATTEDGIIVTARVGPPPTFHLTGRADATPEELGALFGRLISFCATSANGRYQAIRSSIGEEAAKEFLAGLTLGAAAKTDIVTAKEMIIEQKKRGGVSAR